MPATAKTTPAETRAADARARIESALTQLRESVTDLPSRMREEATDMEKAFARFGDDALREIGRMAIRAQRSKAALTDLSAEIRKRKAELSA